ncbi:MAG: PAS domain-containing protein [Candidatus Thorarchaeota archaeon]|nr:PAS domain-containing protein [Candidatus Thorarchaeota archaeon]
MTELPSAFRKAEWEKLIALVLEINGILMTDSNGIILWVNDAFTHITGYSPEEAIGKKTNLLKSGYHDSNFYRILWDTITSGEVWSGVITNRRKDGSYYRELMSIAPLKIEDGSIARYIAMKKDVRDFHNLSDAERQPSAVIDRVVPLMTELNDVTTALEQAKSETNAMLNATSEAIMLLSIDDRMLWLNKAFGRFFSLITQDVIDDFFHNLKSHWDRVFEDSSKIMHIVNSAKENQVSEYREAVSQIWPQKRELEVYSAPVKDASGKYLGQLFVFRDVTRERAIERMKSEFVSLVSHEFRTPLTSICGYTEMLLEGDAGELTDEQTDFLKTIQRNANNLADIINSLLVVSRLEAGAIKLNLGEIEIHDIVDNTIELLRPHIVAKNLKLKVNVNPDLPVVEGDSQWINQVILNLLSNAYKYTPSGGTITISAKAKDDFLYIKITDSGIGMSTDEQKKLFTKFFRAENPETIKAGGTGLGLWISRSLVEMHGGEIFVISKPKKGSILTIKLPIKNK